MHSKVVSVIVFLPSETGTSEMPNNFPCMWNSPLLGVSQETQTVFSWTRMFYQETKLNTIHCKHWRKFAKNSARRKKRSYFSTVHNFGWSGFITQTKTDFGRIIKTVSLSALSPVHSPIIRNEVPPRVPKLSFHFNVKNLLTYLQVVCAWIFGPKR